MPAEVLILSPPAFFRFVFAINLLCDHALELLPLEVGMSAGLVSANRSHLIRRDDHAVMAVRAARKIRRRWSAKRETLARAARLSNEELGVGVGIDSGELSFGEFGRSHRDLTAIGTVVNLASRAQSAAKAGKICRSRETTKPDTFRPTAHAFVIQDYSGIAPGSVIRAAVFADLIDMCDVRMIERGGRLRLLGEATHSLLISSDVSRQDFQGYLAVESHILS